MYQGGNERHGEEGKGWGMERVRPTSLVVGGKLNRKREGGGMPTNDVSSKSGIRTGMKKAFQGVDGW